MIPPEQIKAVLFDFGGTLGYDMENYAQGFAHMTTAAGYPIDAMGYHEASEAAKQELPEAPRDLESWRLWRNTYHRGVLSQIGVPDERLDEMMKMMTARFRYYSRPANYPETHFVLRCLNWASYTVGVISNIAPALPDALEELDLQKHLKFAIASDTFGAQKPDISIFQEGVRLAGEPAEACMYVGDSVEADVEGSMQLGMQPVLIDRDDLHKERDGVLRVTNLVEILDWLGVDSSSHPRLHDHAPSRPS
ncbi:MAG: HAD-IA family hydrolase [Candidatus Latescibacteria bacterium]|jgi:putative hydrolase of the HAD superfamily|nr:HAD-IA family hydrolase [Candidatus Latescibacterota bacterium]